MFVLYQYDVLVVQVIKVLFCSVLLNTMSYFKRIPEMAEWASLIADGLKQRLVKMSPGQKVEYCVLWYIIGKTNNGTQVPQETFKWFTDNFRGSVIRKSSSINGYHHKVACKN